MKIERIDSLDDDRFSKNLLYQRGCFLVDGKPCSFEIISNHEAIIQYEGKADLSKIIEEFRFYTYHITTFYDGNKNLIAKYEPLKVFDVALSDIQPSQFYVDTQKITAIKTFIKAADDIIVPVIRYNDRYISLDGHTRLYFAKLNGWKMVKAIINQSDDYIYDFVNEANKRGIYTVDDMHLLDHESYKLKWYKFCDDFFKKL